MVRRVAVLAGVAVAVVLFAPAAARPTGGTFTYPSPACPQSSTGLANCIAGATSGATIKVKPGVYFESGTVVGHQVTISGACGSTIIDPGDAGDGFEIESINVKFNCLTIRHAGSSYYGINNTTTYGGPYDGLSVSSVMFLDDEYGIYQGTGSQGLNVTKSSFVGLDEYGIYSGTETGGVISGNTFANNGSYCIYIDSMTNGTISSNSFNVCGDAAAYIDGGDNNMVAGNKVKTVDSDCVEIYSTHTTFTKNAMYGCNGDGLYWDADGATVTNNTWAGQIDGETIYLDCSSNAVVTGNKATTGNDDEAFIYVCQNSSGTETITNNTDTAGLIDYGVECSTCDHATVSGNSFPTGGEGTGIYVSGTAPTVTNNLVSGSWDSEGFYVNCTGTCANAVVQKNKEADSNDDYGFELYTSGCASFPCMTISGNTATGNYYDGFYLDTPFAQVTGNTAVGNGYTYNGCGSGYSGFDLVGASQHLSLNIAHNNACDGFYVGTANNVLTSNQAFANIGMGFQVTHDANTLDKNTSTKNHADGINNDGTNTVLTNDKSSGNRQDCTEDDQAPSSEGASIATNTGNTCGDKHDFDWASTLTGW